MIILVSLRVVGLGVREDDGDVAMAFGTNHPFTPEAGRSKNCGDEAIGFIGAREPLAYHPKTGR